MVVFHLGVIRFRAPGKPLFSMDHRKAGNRAMDSFVSRHLG